MSRIAIKSNVAKNPGLSGIRPALLSAYLISLALIIAAAWGDLWLDEIWSISIAQTADKATDIIFRLKHDNNHILNTLFLHYVEEQDVFIVYRLLAILSGAGSIFLVSRLALRSWGHQEALWSVLFLGTSFPILLYFSEARGYAPAMFFALLSYSVLLPNLRSLRLYRLYIFWIASALGLLSHSTFVIVSLALLIMNLSRLTHTGVNFLTRLREFLLHQVPTFIFIAYWYLSYVRHMVIGGGPIYDKVDVTKEAAIQLLGFPTSAPLSQLALIVVLAIIVFGTFCLVRDKNIQWVFFPSVLVLSPLLSFIVTQPKYFYFRYFIVSFPFFYLLLSYLVCRSYRSWATPYRWLLVVFVAVLLSGQSMRVYPLIVLGRGGYTDALFHIMENSSEAVISVGSDHDFRNKILIEFYAPSMSKDKSLRYVEQSHWRKDPPDWFFIHSQDLSYQPSKRIVLNKVNAYRLIDQYRFAGTSGWSWFLYRHQ